MSVDKGQARQDAQPTRHSPGEEPSTAGQAAHGFRNEVSWDGGEGRQPYSNQGDEETPSPAAYEESPEGNRGDKSGVTLDHLDAVKKKP